MPMRTTTGIDADEMQIPLRETELGIRNEASALP